MHTEFHTDPNDRLNAFVLTGLSELGVHRRKALRFISTQCCSTLNNYNTIDILLLSISQRLPRPKMNYNGIISQASSSIRQEQPSCKSAGVSFHLPLGHQWLLWWQLSHVYGHFLCQTKITFNLSAWVQIVTQGLVNCLEVFFFLFSIASRIALFI